jgi:hypothetical protein
MGRWACLVTACAAAGVQAKPDGSAPPPDTAFRSPYAAVSSNNQVDGVMPTSGSDRSVLPQGTGPGGPRVLNQADAPLPDTPREGPPPPDSGFMVPLDVPPGFTGNTSVLPAGVAATDDYVPMEDRWRLGFPSWDRYSKGHPLVVDYPYDVGDICNPYRQNVLKGDYPIIGQNTFLLIAINSIQTANAQQVPTGTTPFQSKARPNEYEFFGSPNQLPYNNILSVDIDLNHGDAAFKPTDWRIHITPTFNVNTLDVDELAVVNPNVTKGTSRNRDYFSLQEYFVEVKLADISPNYDFVSVRAGAQEFNNDFRGFLFDDTNRAVRLFGTALANRVQFNVAYFHQDEKDTDSGLNTFQDRSGQNVILANVYCQDFIFPGYTVQASLAYDHDPASVYYNNDSNLVRPDPVGVAQPHTVDVGYFGLASDGHIDRFNITSQFYQAFGHDTLNPIANHAANITAEMFALELSYDRDWARFRTSFFWASGNHNPNSGTLNGFDGIVDSPNFAGGEFSYWQSQQIKLFGVNLKNADSLLPSLNSDKFDGQANFNNPGLLLLNVGVDFDLTPKLKWINNVNWLWFESAQVLDVYTFAGDIHTSIGTDISTGFEYRPFDSQNVVMLFGASTLIPGEGFKNLYDPKVGSLNPLVAGFVQLNLNY